MDGEGMEVTEGWWGVGGGWWGLGGQGGALPSFRRVESTRVQLLRSQFSLQLTTSHNSPPIEYLQKLSFSYVRFRLVKLNERDSE